MLSDRQLIETDKAYLRRAYANTDAGLIALKAYAVTLYQATPGETEITRTNVGGDAVEGQLTGKLSIRRTAVEEVIVERDPTYVAPVVIPRRLIGATVRLGQGGSIGDVFVQGGNG
jgi:hypothetical protein